MFLGEANNFASTPALDLANLSDADLATFVAFVASPSEPNLTIRVGNVRPNMIDVDTNSLSTAATAAAGTGADVNTMTAFTRGTSGVETTLQRLCRVYGYCTSGRTAMATALTSYMTRLTTARDALTARIGS
jgi:hypothetical protein